MSLHVLSYAIGLALGIAIGAALGSTLAREQRNRIYLPVTVAVFTAGGVLIGYALDVFIAYVQTSGTAR